MDPRAQAFKDAVSLLARQLEPCSWEHHDVTIIYVLGPRTRIDVDNAAKCVLDGLQASGLIKNDSHVLALHQFKRRARMQGNERTIVSVQPFEGEVYL